MTAIENARRRARQLGPSAALRTAAPAPGYETTARRPSPPDAEMLARHEYLTRQRGGNDGDDGGLARRRRELELELLRT